MSFTVIDDTEIDENMAAKVSVYPNPAFSVLNINGIDDFANLEVKIVNIQGQVVMTAVNSLIINVKDIEEGIYFVNINCDGTQIIRRIVVE